jgi:hypothetical protein
MAFVLRIIGDVDMIANALGGLLSAGAFSLQVGRSGGSGTRAVLLADRLAWKVRRGSHCGTIRVQIFTPKSRRGWERCHLIAELMLRFLHAQPALNQGVTLDRVGERLRVELDVVGDGMPHTARCERLRLCTSVDGAVCSRRTGRGWVRCHLIAEPICLSLRAQPALNQCEALDLVNECLRVVLNVASDDMPHAFRCERLRLCTSVIALCSRGARLHRAARRLPWRGKSCQTLLQVLRQRDGGWHSMSEVQLRRIGIQEVSIRRMWILI